MASDAFTISNIKSKRILNIPALEKNKITAKTSTRDSSNVKDFLETIKIDPESAVMAEQIHGNGIAVVNKDHQGSGIIRSEIKACDSLITNIPNIPIIIRTADCIPIFIFEPNKRVIGLVHTGWKGTIAKISELTINKMSDVFNISPSDCIIATGPAIKKDCYEVNEKVIGLLKLNIKEYKKFIVQKDKNHWNLDLLGINIDQFKGLGIKKENIYINNSCTHCETDKFYSYRKEGKNTGRIFSVLMLEE